MSAEVDGACPSRLAGVGGGGGGGGGGPKARQVDASDGQDPCVDAAEATLLTTAAAAAIGGSSSAVKSNQESGGGGGSLHRVADKLKEKLSRQMNQVDDDGAAAHPPPPQGSTEPPSTSTLKDSNQKSNAISSSSSSSDTRSQYHSILKLSSPSSKSFSAVNASRFSPTAYDFPSAGSSSSSLYFGHAPEIYPPPGVTDTLDALRGMMKGGGGGGPDDALLVHPRKRHQVYCRQTGGGGGQGVIVNHYPDFEDRAMLMPVNKYRYSNNDADDDDSDDDDSCHSADDTLAGSVSYDDDDGFSDADFGNEKGNFGRHSRSSSLSNEKRPNNNNNKNLQGKENEEEEEEEEEEYGNNGRGNNGVDDSVYSEGSLEDKIEAKKARVETIINNMRPSPTSKTTPSAAAPGGGGAGGLQGGSVCERSTPTDGVPNGPSAVGGGGSEVRRPKRKQYIPQQHDARESGEFGEPLVKVRKVERDAMHRQLRRMQSQLTEMQQKCLRLIDHQDQGSSFDQRGCCEDETSRLLAGLAGSDLNRNEIQRLSSGILRTIQEDGKELVERASRQLDEFHHPSSTADDAGLQHLAKLLKAEITSSVGTLVDGIIKNFMGKYMDMQKEQTKEPSVQPSNPPKSPKMINAFETTIRETAHLLRQPAREEPFLPVSKPLDAPPLGAIARPPCLPPTLLPPPLQLPVHAPFSSEPNGLRQSVKQQQQQQQRELTEKYMRPYFDLHSKTAFDLPQAHLPLFAPHPFYPHPMAKFQPLFVKEPEQTEALPLVVSTPKKKRTKVTDTRLSPRAARAMLQDSLGQHQQQHHHHHHHHHHQQQQQHPDGHHGHQSQQQPPPPHRMADSTTTRKPFPHHHHYPTLGGIHEAFPHPSMLSIGLPTSVAIHNPSLQHSDLLQAMYPHHPPQPGGLGHRDGGGGGGGGGQQPGLKRPASHSPDFASTPNSLMKCDSDPYDQMMAESLMTYDGHGLTSTLTPMHLRKAKLMFFYVRYPSSAILKIYFPDVKFNKNNTAQLVKWFSNFREFYYIQMEKYARQALAEGVKNVTDLVITTDSELYRVLVLHYNRNNQIEVPENFRFVVQATLREFFISIVAEKDQEQSWKKSIYKIISRMDDAVPEYFKSSNWMEQLVDG